MKRSRSKNQTRHEIDKRDEKKKTECSSRTRDIRYSSQMTRIITKPSKRNGLNKLLLYSPTQRSRKPDALCSTRQHQDHNADKINVKLSLPHRTNAIPYFPEASISTKLKQAQELASLGLRKSRTFGGTGTRGKKEKYPGTHQVSHGFASPDTRRSCHTHLEKYKRRVVLRRRNKEPLVP